MDAGEGKQPREEGRGLSLLLRFIVSAVGGWFMEQLVFDCVL
jgi:hypothetical protein